MRLEPTGKLMDDGMRIVVISALLIVVVGVAHAKPYEECILDEMPGVANDSAAQAIHRVCMEQHDKTAERRTGYFKRYKSGADCTAKVARDTQSRVGAMTIGRACEVLYGAAPPYGGPWSNY